MNEPVSMRKQIQQAVSFPMRVLEPVRDYLLQERVKLRKTAKSLDKEDPYKDPRRVDDNAAIDTDVAEHADHDRVEAVRQEVRKSLINIRKALTRIKLGRYGLCENCGRMINTDRLAIKPTADYCMACEQKVEKSGKK